MDVILRLNVNLRNHRTKYIMIQNGFTKSVKTGCRSGPSG